MIILKSDHAIPYVCQFALQDEERALHIDNKNASFSSVGLLVEKTS